MVRGRLPLQVAIVLIVTAMVAGCASLVVSGAPAGGHGAAANPGGGQTSHDAAITSAITSTYLNDPLVDALAIRVTTYQGVVTLQGSVKSQAAAARAVELARATPHVRRVISRLTVTP